MGTALERGWARLRRTLGSPVDPIEAAVTYLGAAHPDATFVQIGANDGMALDPLRREIQRRGWRGVMVEPVPFVFERLAAQYEGHPRVDLVQAAVAEAGSPATFYHLREAEPGEEVWEWYHALGSFRREVVLRHADVIPDIEDRLVETVVPCITFEELCAQHGLDQVDLVQIDTEGYDFEILKEIDLDRHRPWLVIYEHQHLDADDRAAARARLHAAGYSTFENGLDTAAFDVERAGPAEQRLVKLFRTTPDRPAAR